MGRKRGYKATPEENERNRQNTKARWADPEQREKMMKSQRRIGSDRSITKQGYVVLLYKYDHPLCSPDGRVLEHRFVLYEKIGPGSHQCHWCDKVLEWGGAKGIHADHLDDDRLNNDPDNLVPSCKKCNGDRGKKKEVV